MLIRPLNAVSREDVQDVGHWSAHSEVDQKF